MYNVFNIQWLQICTYFSTSQPHMIRTLWSKLLATVVTLPAMQPPVSMCMYDKSRTHKQLFPTTPNLYTWSPSHPHTVAQWQRDDMSSCFLLFCVTILPQSGWEHACSPRVYLHTLLSTFLCLSLFFFLGLTWPSKEKLFNRSTGSAAKETCRLSNQVRDLVWKSWYPNQNKNTFFPPTCKYCNFEHCVVPIQEYKKILGMICHQYTFTESTEMWIKKRFIVSEKH